MGESGKPDIGSMVGTFEKVASNKVTRFLLKRAVSYCEKDGGNRVEVAIELYLGRRERACPLCELTSKLVGYVVRRGTRSFGVAEERFKERMADPYWRKGLASVIKGIALFGVRRPFVPGAPFQVVWNITRACNMRCLHCYENAGRRDIDELSREEVLRGIDILARAGVAILAFSGGEPTIHPNILEFVEHAHKRGMYVAMATNGYLLSDKELCKKFAEAGLGFVQISLDGLNPKTHDGFRRVNGAWQRAVEAVRNCVEAGMFVEVATTVTKYNYHEIPEMIEFVRSLGAHWFMLYNFVPTGRGVEIVKDDISPEERFKLLELAFKENGKGGMQVLSTAPQYAMVAQVLSSGQAETIVPTHFYNPKYSDPYTRQLADFIGGCGAGRFYVSIEPNGDIYPCVFFPHSEAVKIGNLLRDDFEKLWRENELLWKLRDKDILEGYCGKCQFRYTCGGCRARAYAYFGDVLAPDPGCIYCLKEWEEVRGGGGKLPKLLKM